ncbi:MAG: regulatory protein GemA [Desulfovibrio sp.]|jgi:phage gp16-like protein|nr:regulatory protein GemA [Desulfovibrio sp.]
MACAYQRFIKMAQRKLGLDDETYRNFLEDVTGKRSTTEMTVKQRWRVVEELKRKGMSFESNGAKNDATKDDLPQSRLARHLWLKLKDYGALRNASETALLAYVKRLTGKQRLEWCNAQQRNQVVETLKQWVDRIEAECAGKTA